MVKNANELVENLVSVFLEANMEHLNILMTSTQNVINENNMEIMKFLKDHGVDEDVLEKLTKMLKM
jgi:hypothetical protein